MDLKETLRQRLGVGKVEKNGVVFRQQIKKSVRSEVSLYKQELNQELRRILADVLGKDGLTTIKGDRGYTPKKGVDYLTDAEIKELLGKVTPKKGVDYFDGKTPKIKIPKKGVDYFDGQPGKDVNIDEVIQKIKDGKLLGIADIRGLAEALAEIRNRAARFGGGGGGGGEGSWKVKTLSGTINGSNTSFTFAGEAPAENSHHVMLNYQEQNPLVDYTISGTTVTYAVAPDASLSGFPHYIRYT